MTRTFWVAGVVLALAGAALAKIVDRIVAQVNDDIITLSDLNREVALIRQELATQYSGEQLEAAVKKAEKEALDNLIRDKLLLQKGNELGFGANIDVQVSAAVERIRKENKLKDAEELERALAQQGLTLAGFRERIRRQIIIDGVIDSFVRSRITLLSNEIEKYYKDHVSDFSSAEEVALSEIIIPIEGDAAAAEARANDVHRRLTQGEAFATLASQYSKGPSASKGGSIGSYATRKLNAEVASAITGVKEGEVTPVLKSRDGFVIYRVDARKKSENIPLEQVRSEIQQRLFAQKFGPEMDRFVAQLKEDAYIQIFGDAGK
jgi:peptidyl-prolyl cis-trans isomerase SurA